jgi:N-methylhydantoinase B
MAANRLGVTRMQELCAKYAPEIVVAAGKALQDYAERKMRIGLKAIRDGTYRFSDVFDHPEISEEIPLAVEITIAGDEIVLRFDSPPQRRGPANATFTALLATVYYALKTIVDPTILPNAGLGRPIRVLAEPGTVLNCVLPAAVDGRLAPCQRVVDLIYGALSEVVPERVTAAANGACMAGQFIGMRPDGSTWIYAESIGGGNGARFNKDGLDGVHVHLTNTSNLPVEALEREYPLTLLRYELVDGSGGPGRFRGGLGLRRVYRAEGDCRMRVEATRERSAPWGLAGGLAGGKSSYRSSKSTEGNVFWLSKGDIAEIVTPGGGGFGPPQERAGSAVNRDVREGTIDREAARQIYGFEEG